MNIRKKCLPILLLTCLYGGLASVNGQDADISASTLDETDLIDPGTTVTVSLIGAKFVRDGSISREAFVPVNAPAGLTVETVTAASDSTSANVSLKTTDFDVDHNYFYLLIQDSVLKNVTGDLATDTCALTANVERAVLSSSPLPLSERNIDNDGSARLQIDLINEEFESPQSLDVSDFTLVNFPSEIAISGFAPSGKSKQQALLEIRYTPGDFDAPIYDAAVIINNPARLKYSTDTLGTDTLLILATTESVAFISGSNLDEKNLDQGVVVVNLVNDQISGTLGVNDLGLVNFPAGTSIQSASSSGGTQITINLNFDGTDFDVNDTDGQIRVKSSILTWNKTSDLLTPAGAITITASPPSARVAGSSWLREFFLDTMSLHVSLEEEEFGSNPINVGDFEFLNAPEGLNVVGFSGKTDTTITLELSFSGPDFDDPFDDVRLTIDGEILVNTSSTYLFSDPFTIDPNIEPAISSVSIPNDTMKIGDLVAVTIHLSDYVGDSVYTLAGGTIGGTVNGYPLGPVVKEAGNRYRSSFTVTEGGNDFGAAQSIPVDNLRLDDLPVTGESFDGSMVQDYDLLDAHRPVISSVYVLGQGKKQIGDEVVLLISAFEEKLRPEDTTEINKVPFSRSNVLFEEIGGGSYSLIYTVEAGDPDVAQGALDAKIYLRDPAGNVNAGYPGIAPNTLSIDATVPVILSTTNTTPTDTVIIGGEVILTVQADGTGYSLSDDSEVNGVKKSGGLIFSSAGTTYTVRYPVKDNHPSVAAGDLRARIILLDPSGNPSLPDTVILANDVAVLTQKPSALLTGNPKICIHDSATLYVTLGGAPPWRLKYRNSVESFYIDDIMSVNHTLRVSPTETTGYSIDSVWDGTGNRNTGLGNSLVIVNPLPDVSILNLKPQYAVTDETPVTLQGSPSGGSFSGPGVNTVTGVFTPSTAGLTGVDPHWIYYAYTDANTCFNVDSQAVRIIMPGVTFHWPNDTFPTACYFHEDYTLGAENLSGTIGAFKLDTVESFPDGFMTDNGDNTVTFNPSILDWESGWYYLIPINVRYEYVNENGVELYQDTILSIEYFDTTYIDEDLAGRKTCSDQTAFDLLGSRPSSGVFSGPGVVDLGDFEYKFDPGIADFGENRIYYTYVSPNRCIQKDSAIIITHRTPEPEFAFIDTCVLGTGGLVSFRNETDTAGLGSAIKWTWVYGDIPSGVNNRDEFFNMQDGSHYYPGPGLRTVTLTAADTTTTCFRVKSITREIGNTPDIGITWNTECFTGDPVQFTGVSQTIDVDSIFRWRIRDMSGTEIRAEEGPGLRSLAHAFGSIDNYSIEFSSVTENGCQAGATDTIYLRPYIRNITDDAPYVEGFEGETTGWYAFAGKGSPQQRWTLGTVLPEQFPYDLPDSGSTAWYTDKARKDTVEQSWVSSPCFDFSNMRRPMISLDRKVSSDRDRDGAALQYTYDDGKTWHNVGAINDGRINWYNTFRIQDGPGGQGEGWTGGFVFEKYEPWKQSRHDLDELTGRPRVQFRIAYGSSGESVFENEGFAFDNVWIGERSRVVLIEHFTNSGLTESNAANERINRLVTNNPLDVIDVQYHAEVDGFTDRMNLDNPAPASARGLFYGTRQVPYMLMDGGPGGKLAYNFADLDLDTLDLFARALTDPSFRISLDVQDAGEKLDITVGLEALEDLPDAEYMVNVVILEKRIDDPAYAGAGSVSSFENVVRAMVPTAAGMNLLRSWQSGEKESIPMSWTISDRILSRDMLTVVAFVQDAESREVYQAASNDEDLNGDPVIHTSVADLLKSRDLAMMVYPNPASGRAYLAFAGELPSPVEIQMFSNTGTLVRNAVLPAGTEVYEMDLGGMEQGIYFIRAIRQDKVIGTHKFMIAR